MQVDQEDSLTSEDITTRQSRVAKAMENAMPPTPLPASPPPSLPSTPYHPPTPTPGTCSLFSQGTHLSSSCCAFIFTRCITPSSAPEGENTLASAPGTEGAPKVSTEGAILSTSLMIPLNMQAEIHVKYGPFQEVVCLHSSLGFN